MYSIQHLLHNKQICNKFSLFVFLFAPYHFPFFLFLIQLVPNLKKFYWGDQGVDREASFANAFPIKILKPGILTPKTTS